MGGPDLAHSLGDGPFFERPKASNRPLTPYVPGLPNAAHFGYIFESTIFLIPAATTQYV